MSLKYKSLFFLALTALVLYFNYPTILALLTDTRQTGLDKLNARLPDIQKQVESLKSVNLALVELEKNRVKLLPAPGKTDELTTESPLFQTPMMKEALGEHTTVKKDSEGLYVEINPGAPRDVFLSDIATALNTIFENVKKIKSVELNREKAEIRFVMEEGRRLSEKSEPVKTIVGEEFDWTYHQADNSYAMTVKEPTFSLNLGLDLKGGIYLDLGLDTTKIYEDQLRSKADVIKTVLTNDKKEVRDIKTVGTDTIEVYADRQAVNLRDDNYSVLMQGYDIQDTDYGYSLKISADELKNIEKTAVDQAINTIRNRIDQLGVKEPNVSRKGTDGITVQLPGVNDPERAVAIIKQSAVLEFRFVTDTAEGTETDTLNEETRDPVTREVVDVRPITVEKKVAMRGDAITYISLTLKPDYANIFGDITANNRGRLMAIVLDGIVQSAPRINDAIYGGQASISGNFSIEEARDLALVLRSGSLPAPLVINEQKTVGSSLGEDTIRQSLFAMVTGFICLVLFVIVWYRLSGLYAVLTLIFNLLLMTACLAYVGATLTLPGIAGIILTIGMAVDANVLIYERIREEMKTETMVRKVIADSFRKAFSTIMDANITTLCAGAVLFQFGSGPVKGFAVTLTIGIFTSVFSAMLFTRFLLELTYLRRSGSGTNIQVQFASPHPITEIREKLKGVSAQEPSVQIFGNELNNEVLIQFAGQDDEKQNEALVKTASERIKSAYPDSEIRQVETIGPKVGSELKEGAVYAVLLSFAAIMIYIAFRFKLYFGLGALVALVHDTLITLGFLIIFGYEFNLAVLAAVLTVNGYSLNDTIVVFDRIRENLGKYSDPLGVIINRSVNETLSRTMITSGTTMISVLFLYIFGGQELQGFAFAILIGIIVGTYSSVFVASPVLVLFYRDDKNKNNPADTSAGKDKEKATAPRNNAIKPTV
ncbi:hypothetical protein CHS0354_018381 [Potamilus streckersoni]|uniref:Protein-export membrane protein SecF n=1 Tax=Potamilus streckersoni TaxID=2493646 RepID=A0AAE0TAH8_9BIVA|nr:hypothetical protein CHS0354_018381 [Potamilus streckersoni]